jgi:hypothetical protein
MRLKKYNILKLLIIFSFLFFLGFSHNSQAANSAIDILWQAQTYTPAWYKGKALPVIQSRIKAVAVTPGISSSKLIYEWYLNFQKNINASGIGKSSFSFQIKNYEEQVITVRISNQNKNLIDEKSVILSANKAKPEIIFYEDSPVYGTLFNKALQGYFNLLKPIFNLRAEPYFFSNANSKALKYKWKMNNDEDITDDESQVVVNFQKPEKEGTAVISLKIQNFLNVLQFTEERLRINF